MATKTQLTPSTFAVPTIYSTYAQITFNIIYNVWWIASVNLSTTSCVNPRDAGNGTAIFKAGLTVNLIKTSTGGYNLKVSGDIVDLGSTYTLTNFPIGSYTP